MKPKFIGAFAAVVILGLGIAGGYGIAMHRMMSNPTSNTATQAGTPDKKPLYYYDPMYYHDEEEADQLMMDVQRDVLDPQVIDYIFWPDGEMTAEKAAEEIIDRALAYQPTVAYWSPE